MPKPTTVLGRKRHTAVAADHLSTRIVRLPAWFTVAQAARVAELRSVSHILVEERGRVRGTVSRTSLTSAPPTDPIARWLERTESFVSPHTPIELARAVMERDQVSCLPVVSDGLLVGTLALDDIGGVASAQQTAA